MFRISIYTIFLLFTCSAQASWDTENDEEALFLRRIADFWQEGEYQIVKTQIEEFLQIYPNSPFAQTLHATLGDLLLREENFKAALLSYSRIFEEPLKDRVFFNRMQCLLELQWFATLADECEQTLKTPNLKIEKQIKTTYLLAVALYQQCLNATPNSEELELLAKRALPYFQSLLDSEYGPETGPAFAHLCCLQKNYPMASDIYLQLSRIHDHNEEMFFQAALLQAKADRSKAIEMFEELETLNQARAPDALYNRIVLMAETESYEKLAFEKENFLPRLSPERQDAARLFFGHSYLKLKRYQEAAEELSLFIEKKSDSSESHRSALRDLIEASYELEDEKLLQVTIARLADFFPKDQQLAKGVLAYALLLKKQHRIEEAKTKLQTLLSSDFQEERERASFEFSHLEYLQQHWEQCRLLCLSFLEQFPKSEYSVLVWRFLATSSFHLSSSIELKEQFMLDLESLLKQNSLFSEQELNDWRFELAKVQFECKRYEAAKNTIETFLLTNPLASYYADAHLLLALCIRDGEGDISSFYHLAEKALNLGSELFEKGTLQIALFNASIELKDFDRAAEHLYQASQSKTLETDHLLWLADYYYEKAHKSTHTPNLQRAVELLEKFLAHNKISLHQLTEPLLSFEPIVIKLAELYAFLNYDEQSRALLESLRQQRTEHPEWSWEHPEKIDFLLAENYARNHREKEALKLFDAVQEKSSSLRNYLAASAALQSARLRLAVWKKTKQGVPIKILTQLKNLVLQRTLINEPIHLEAAFEYIDLQTKLENNSSEKRLALSYKTKEDFENGTDLLAKDYQQSRKNNPEKELLYSAYMELLDAEILLCKAKIAHERSETTAYKQEAHDLLTKLSQKSTTPFLEKRIKKLLSKSFTPQD